MAIAGVRAVLFDFDFTLGDSSPGIVECVNCGLAAIGSPPAPAEAIRRRIGLTLPEVLACLEPSSGDDQVARFIEAFHRRADEVMESSTEVYAHGIALVKKLKIEGVRTGIVSTKLRHRIESILKRRELTDLFDIVVGLEDVTEHKPHPEGLLLALRRLMAAPAEALYIGDHVVDVEAAQRAGVKFLGVLTGMTSPQDFARLGASSVPDLSHVEGRLASDAVWRSSGIGVPIRCMQGEAP